MFDSRGEEGTMNHIYTTADGLKLKEERLGMIPLPSPIGGETVSIVGSGQCKRHGPAVEICEQRGLEWLLGRVVEPQWRMCGHRTRRSFAGFPTHIRKAGPEMRH